MLIAMAMMLGAMQAPYSPSDKAAACARSDSVAITPGDTLQLLDDFRAGLTVRDRERLDRALPRDAKGGIAQCDASEGSRASCEAWAYMPALRSTGLMPRFLATICPNTPDAPSSQPVDHSVPTFIPHHTMPSRQD